MKKLIAIAALLFASPVLAQGPESLDQLEPGGGEVQLEWLGDFGGEGEQGLELLFGVSDMLVIGAEAEFEGPREGLVFEEASAVVMWRFADPGDVPVGLGLMGEVAVDRGGRVSGLEARGIVEVQRGGWWLQGNAMLRHMREDGERGTGLAYSASVQRDVGGLFVGIEASGQAVRLGGEFGLGHYAGPSVTFEHEFGDEREVEIGLAWLERLKGDGAPSGPRVFVQFTF
ncbi:hypothetical protein M9978_00565 [Sphingomonas sp. MG17]|uniref:MetA-pathway of phenol degradation n=1 Tax=Sphingomonas tagetis TaxID=2949092 RepID=A0A9X2HD56_9SPHN|nr:hypothetical protein [Sphingomonas tagetis]MCP3728911.1 hypothetical protein [Sphingomonas tagetis]